jgi:hypothetical protein
MLYNGACAYSRLGERDRAARMLRRAVEQGFVDFAFMKQDPDLAAIRDHPVYEAIVEAARRIAGRPAGSALEWWKRRFGMESYRYETDDRRRLAFATALDDRSHREMRGMLETEADHLIEAFFGAPPDYVVLIAVPTPQDAEVLFKGDDQIGGIYEHAKRRLISRDIGGSLRHEFFHAMHYGHMERLRQPHRLWIQEGLASLYEDYDLDPEGAARYLPNHRHNVVKARAKAGRLVQWRLLFEMDGDRFMARAGALYPQVRSMFEFVADEGKLGEWYAAYVEHFDEDPGGARAFEAAFDMPVEEVERRWRQWLARRPALDLRIDPRDAAIGIRSDDNLGNDGVVVTDVIRGSAASGRLRRGDVIVSVDGTPTRSFMELRSVVAARQVGETAVLRVRRGDRYLAITLVLRPINAGI